MKEQTIIKLINHLNSVLSKGISKNAYEEEMGLPTNYFWLKKKQLEDSLAVGKLTQKEYDKMAVLYKKIEDRGIIRSPKKATDEQVDDTSRIDIERDEVGKIVRYSFTIFIRDKQPILGSFTRDEMNMVYRLYSNYGSDITQREVSRFFPDYSLIDFKRILRAFNITKASAPFAQHVIEENDKSQLLDMQFREKENDFLRSYEAEKVRFTETQLKKYMKENQDLKQQLGEFSGLLKDINISNLPKWKPTVTSRNDRDLIIWLSDMHVGASVSGHSIYENEYNQEAISDRLMLVFNQIKSESLMFGNFRNIVVCNLGDSLDGYNGETTRGGHKLPQNMNNKEQLHCYITVMTEFMTNLAQEIPCSSLSYYCVGESNHKYYI